MDTDFWLGVLAVLPPRFDVRRVQQFLLPIPLGEVIWFQTPIPRSVRPLLFRSYRWTAKNRILTLTIFVRLSRTTLCLDIYCIGIITKIFEIPALIKLSACVFNDCTSPWYASNSSSSILCLANRAWALGSSTPWSVELSTVKCSCNQDSASLASA